MADVAVRAMRILVCGSRGWTDRHRVLNELLELHNEAVLKGAELPLSEVTVIDGGAKGADQIAYEAAIALGMKSERYPADWNRYGKRAGYVRNQQMLDEGKPDTVLAFWDGKSRGTAMMIELSNKAKVPVKVIKV